MDVVAETGDSYRRSTPAALAPVGWRAPGLVVVAAMCTVVAALNVVAGEWILAFLWSAVATTWAARSWLGADFLDPFALRRRAKARTMVRTDPQFGSMLAPEADARTGFDVRIEFPTGQLFRIRCRARDERDAVARAHMAVLYRERRGLNGWVAADGVSGVNGAAIAVERLPTDTATDEWRVDYRLSDGTRLAK